jgi:hypothetical protein
MPIGRARIDGALFHLGVEEWNLASSHQRDAGSRHGDRGGDVAFDETSTSREIDTTKVSMTKHFGHSNVRESKPGLSGSMIRNVIFSPHFLHRGSLVRSTNIVYPPVMLLLDIYRVSNFHRPMEPVCANPMFGT